MPSACGQSDPNRMRSTGRCCASIRDVVLHERGDPAVLVELVDRVRAEHAGVLAVQHLESVEQVAHPGPPVLDVGDAQARMPLEELVGDEDPGEVVDQAVLHQHGDDRRVLVDRVSTQRMGDRPHSSPTAWVTPT